MSTFKERLLDEKNNLCSNIGKLSAFIISKNFEDIAAEQKSLLNIQLQAMETYRQCLEERLRWLELSAV